MSVWRTTTLTRMAELGLSQQQLAAYAALNKNQLTDFFAGLRDLDNPSLVRLGKALTDLEQLAALAKPWPLDFRKVSVIEGLMAQVRRGELPLTPATLVSD